MTVELLGGLNAFSMWLCRACVELRIDMPAQVDWATPMEAIVSDEYSALALLAKAETDFGLDSSPYPYVAGRDGVSVWSFLEIIRWQLGLPGTEAGVA